MIGGVGQRMLAGVAKKTAGEFFTAVERDSSRGRSPRRGRPGGRARPAGPAPVRSAGLRGRPAPAPAERARSSCSGRSRWSAAAIASAGCRRSDGGSAVVPTCRAPDRRRVRDGSSPRAAIRAVRAVGEDVVRRASNGSPPSRTTCARGPTSTRPGARAGPGARPTNRAAGPLHGVPVGVKDIVDTADQPTRTARRSTPATARPRRRPVVARLRAAGAVVVGKTVTTEFALFHPGPTTNPHDPTGPRAGRRRVRGGGRGRHVPLALGTQTAGSVVRPASFCGVVGASRPSARPDRRGEALLAHARHTSAPSGATSRDAALALGVLADDVAASAPRPRGPAPARLLPDPQVGRLEPDPRDARGRGRAARQVHRRRRGDAPAGVRRPGRGAADDHGRRGRRRSPGSARTTRPAQRRPADLPRRGGDARGRLRRRARARPELPRPAAAGVRRPSPCCSPRACSARRPRSTPPATRCCAGMWTLLGTPTIAVPG
jgi:hypothetical protein